MMWEQVLGAVLLVVFGIAAGFYSLGDLTQSQSFRSRERRRGGIITNVGFGAEAAASARSAKAKNTRMSK
jgi:hypothetical protein